jgi:hypothetical protein
MIRHADLTGAELFSLMRCGAITLGGNGRLRIYGRLDCASGKRLKRQNRVFFSNENEAIRAGYRPCGHCLKQAYRAWHNRSG